MALKFVQTGQAGAGGGGGTYDHNLLVNRGLPDQHTIESITGLRNALDRKYEKPFTGIPKTDLGFAVATMTDIDFLRKTDIADLGDQINAIIAEITDARGGLDTLRQYIDTKVSYSEWSGGGGSGGGGGVGSEIGYPINEKVVATEGQTIFVLPKKYRVGTGQLEVYYDGLKMIEGEDYREVDETTVEFLFPLEEGHMVLFQVRAVINSGLHEEYVATASQTIFRLNSPYGINQNILQVYRNGNLLRKGHDYREIDDLTIEMMQPMIEGDFITFHQAGATDPMAGTILESEVGRVKTNLGYTTMMLHDATGSTRTDYLGMYVDTFITDNNIDKAKSYEYAFVNNAIEVREIDRSLGNIEDFRTGITVDTDIETYPDVIILRNLPGGADRHSFGVVELATPSGTKVNDIFIVQNQYRHRFTFFVKEESAGVTKLMVEILKHDGSVTTHEIDVTDGFFFSLFADIDSKGRVHLVYHEQGGSVGVSRVFHDMFDENGRIAGANRVVSDSNYDAISPHLDVDQNDVAHIVFLSKRVHPTYLNVDYVTIDSTGTQTSPKDLTVYNAFDALNPRIAVGTDGLARVVFETLEYDGTTKNLKYIILVDGIKSYEEFITTSTLYDNVMPDIDIAADNSLKIVWRSRRLSSMYGIDFCSIDTNNLISSVQSVASGFTCQRPRISVDHEGISHVVFDGNYTRSDTQNICYAMVYTVNSVSQIYDVASVLGKHYIDPNIYIYGSDIFVGFISDVDSYRIEKSLANYVSAGSFEMVFDAGAENSKWNAINSTTIIPAGSMLEISYRLSNDKVGWSAWRPSADIASDSTVGRFIHIRVTMSSVNPDVTPELTSLNVRYLPTFIEILSVTKTSDTDVDGIIPIAQYTGDVTFAVSRDGGTTFKDAIKDRVADMVGTPAGRNIVLKAKIPQGAKLDAWGAIW